MSKYARGLGILMYSVPSFQISTLLKLRHCFPTPADTQLPTAVVTMKAKRES